MKVSTIVLLLVVFEVSAVKLPESFKRCRRKDDKCLAEAVQEVIEMLTRPIPEVGLARLDPLEIPAVTIGPGSGPVSIEERYRNVKVHGFSALKIGSASFDFEKKILHLDEYIPAATFAADYVLSGKILLVPVQGDGPSANTMERLKATLDMPFIEVQKDGKTYLKFKGTRVTLNPEHVKYHFENLFNGDKVLGDNVNNVLNENWKEVFDEVRGGYEKAFALIMENIANGLFSRVPVSEIFLD